MKQHNFPYKLRKGQVKQRDSYGSACALCNLVPLLNSEGVTNPGEFLGYGERGEARVPKPSQEKQRCSPALGGEAMSQEAAQRMSALIQAIHQAAVASD